MTSSPVPSSLLPATVSRGRRVAARLLTGLPPAIIGVVMNVSLVSSMVSTSNGYAKPGSFPPLFLICSGLILGWCMVNLFLIFTKSRTFGSTLMRFEYRKLSTGEPAGPMLFLKLLISDMLVSFTCGIMALVFFFNYRDGQTLVDKWLEMVAVHPDKLLKNQPAAAPATPRVQPVTMPTVARPQGPAKSWDSERPIAGQQGEVAGRRQISAVPVNPNLGEQPTAVPIPVTTGLPQQLNRPANSTEAVNPAGSKPSAGTGPILIERSPFAPAEGASSPMPAARPFAEPPSVAVVEHSAVQNAKTGLSSRVPVSLSDETVVDDEWVEHEGAIQVVLDDETIIEINTPVVLGRNPVVPEAFPDARVHALLDTSMKLSKTHCVIFSENNQIQVYDVGARNGVIFDVEGEKTKIAAEAPVAIPDNAIVRFGGRSLRVMR